MTEKELPDKCEFCGLRQTFPFNTGDLFPSLHLLVEKNIIKDKFPRKLYASADGDENDREDFCLISHLSWLKKENKCKSWQLDVGLSKGDSLSINLTSEMRNMTKRMELYTIVIFVCTIITLIFTTIQIYILYE